MALDFIKPENFLKPEKVKWGTRRYKYVDGKLTKNIRKKTNVMHMYKETNKYNDHILTIGPKNISDALIDFKEAIDRSRLAGIEIPFFETELLDIDSDEKYVLQIQLIFDSPESKRLIERCIDDTSIPSGKYMTLEELENCSIHEHSIFKKGE